MKKQLNLLIKLPGKITKNTMLSLVQISSTTILYARNYITTIRKKYIIRLYQTIDELPLLNYINLTTTADLNYLRVKYRKSRVSFEKEFEKMTISLIDRFGVSNHYKDTLYKQREILILKIRYLMTEDDGLLNNINNLQRKLDSKKQSKQSTIQEQLMAMNTFFKTSFTIKELTVSEYYSLAKRYERTVFEMSKKNGK